MPKILIYKYLTFFFYAGDLGEAGHVHVVNNKSFLAAAKIWFDKDTLEGGIGVFEEGNLSKSELKTALRVVALNKQYLKTQWSKFQRGERTAIKKLKKI